MNRFLTSTWLSAPVGVVVYLLSTILFWQTPKPPPRPQPTTSVAFSGPSWEFNNPEADQLIAELKSEKKSLDLRSQQLDDLATRLKSERAELGLVTQSVQKLETDFDSSVVRVKQDETVNLKKLAKVYDSMSPDSAATVLSQMDDQAIVKILGYLKEDQTGAILDSLAKQGTTQARRAAQISDLMRLLTHETTSK